MTMINTTPLGQIDTQNKVNSIAFIVGMSILGMFGFVAVMVVLVMLGFKGDTFYFLYLVVVGILAMAFVKMNHKRRDAIAAFVAENHMTRIPEENLDGLLPPSLANEGSHRSFSNAYELSVDGKPVELFDYSYQKISDSGHGLIAVSVYGVAVIRVDKTYPHIYLDGKANGGNDIYKSWQKISLEGDFDKYFTAYSEKNAEIETLEFLTPDTMARFIDNAQSYDIEVYGNTVAIIFNRTIYSKQAMDGLLRCLDALLPHMSVAAQAADTPASAINPVKTLLHKKKRIVSGYTILFITIFVVFYLARVLQR